MGGSTSSGATPIAPVDLGTAGSAALIASSTITDAGASRISGDIALSPGTSITGFPPAVQTSGALQVSNAAAVADHGAAAAAYGDAAGRVATEPITADLAGNTYGPGVYNAVTAMALTGSVTLDAGGNPDAVFIFRAGTTLTTSALSAVVLAGGANACNVYWAIGSSATLGAATQFAGTMLIYSSATLGAQVNDSGRIFALNGAITLDGDAVDAPVCGPSAPLAAHQVDGDGSTLVSWIAPASQGGSAISGYLVQLMAASGSTWQDATMCQGVTPTSCLVTGLDNALGYTFRVRASNTTGPGGTPGTWSAPTVDNSPPMSAPTALPGHGSADVSWLPLVDMHGATIAATYLVTSSPDGATCVTTATSCQVTGLTNDTAYTFTVMGTDGSGATTFSPRSSGVTPTSGVPGPPVVTAVTGSKAAITIAFTPPSGVSVAITGYLASCRSSDGGYVRINQPGNGKPLVTTSPFIVGGLTNGAHYTCTVAAFNNQGRGISSAASSSVVPGTTPRPPRLIGATPTGNGSVSVRFSVPILSGGHPIVIYAATCSSANGGVPQSATASAAGLVAITSLTVGSTYTCSVQASNIVGTGPNSNPSKPVIVN